MAAKSPRERLELLFDAINRKDLDGAVSCYEQTALVTQKPAGPDAAGMAAIREALAGFLAFRMEMADVREACDASREIALTGLTWKASGSGPDGKPLSLGGKSTEVLRRQKNGDWLIVIDSPWWVG
jgi:ketosteroid isomerase-like protein